MRQIDNIRESLPLFEALGSEVRIEIVEQLLRNESMNLDELAKTLHLTNGALTTHIRKLETAGIIKTTSAPGLRGTQKRCQVVEDKIIISILAEGAKSGQSFDIPIGSYNSYSTVAPCVIAGKNALLGQADEPRYFSYPERFNAEALAVSGGYLEYNLPQPFKNHEKIHTVELGLEIAPLHLHADMEYYINGHLIASNTLTRTADRQGLLTPKWWHAKYPQYGSFLSLTATHDGTFLDNVRISDFNTSALGGKLTFRIASKDGFVLFNKSFGDSNIGIRLRLSTK